MAKTYEQQLQEEYDRAMAKYQAELADARKELDAMTVQRAADYGAAYACRLDRVTAAAAKVQALAEQIGAWNYFKQKTEG